MKRPATPLRWLIPLTALVSLVFSLALLLMGLQMGKDTEGRNSFSSGALGHRAFLDFLKAMEIRADRLTFPSFDSPRAPLFFIEPSPKVKLGGRNLIFSQALSRRLRVGLPTVVILPKWKRSKGRVSLLPLSDVKKILGAAAEGMPSAEGLEVRRAGLTGAGRVKGGVLLRGTRSLPDLVVDLPEPQTLSLGGGGEVLLGRPGAALAVGFPGREGPLFLVSDPDLLHNFNLQRADHGAFWALLLERVLGAEEVVVDEVFHGKGRLPSLWAQMVRFPESLIPFQILVLLFLLGWAAFHRFGPARGEKGAVARGPGEFVAAAGMVLARTMPEAHLARKYVEWMIRDTAVRFHSGDDLAEAARLLDQLAERKGLEPAALRALEWAEEAEESGRPWEETAGPRAVWALRKGLFSRPGRARTTDAEKGA